MFSAILMLPQRSKVTWTSGSLFRLRFLHHKLLFPLRWRIVLPLWQCYSLGDQQRFVKIWAFSDLGSAELIYGVFHLLKLRKTETLPPDLRRSPPTDWLLTTRILFLITWSSRRRSELIELLQTNQSTDQITSTFSG